MMWKNKFIKNNHFVLKLILIFFAMLISWAQIAATPHQTIEKQIATYTLSHRQEQLALLEELVNINSGTMNVNGVHQVGEVLRPLFEALGFKVRWEEVPNSMARAGTFIAEHPGTTGKRVLLIGHLDTVFPLSSSFQRFKQQGRMATGPGVIDDKGGDVVILYALKALQAANVLSNAPITVILTGDEEDSGKPTSISRQALLEAAKKSDVALDFEWAITPDTATIARRGISNWTLITEGKEAHSSEIFQEKTGFGAVYEMARILDDMRLKLSNEQYLSLNPGLILGGTTVTEDKANSQGSAIGKENIIAKTALAKGDLRFMTEAQKRDAEEKIAAIVNAHLPDTKAAITFKEGIPAMPPTAANLKLLKQYNQASMQLGYGAVNQLDPGLRGAGDISHIASFVSASLAGLGPVGTGAHSEKETLDIDSLSVQTARAALLIYGLVLSA